MSQHVADFGKLVRDEMDRFGLFDKGWDYGYDRAKKRLGQCCFGPKLITFSLPYINCNAIEQMHNTILHEIAHALVGPGEGHGIIWKNKARSIGAKPQRCNDDPLIIKPMGDYMFKCACNVYYFHRKTRSNSRKCLRCGTSGYIVPTGNFSEPISDAPIKIVKLSARELLAGAFE